MLDRFGRTTDILPAIAALGLTLALLAGSAFAVAAAPGDRPVPAPVAFQDDDDDDDGGGAVTLPNTGTGPTAPTGVDVRFQDDDDDGGVTTVPSTGAGATAPDDRTTGAQLAILGLGAFGVLGLAIAVRRRFA